MVTLISRKIMQSLPSSATTEIDQMLLDTLELVNNRKRYDDRDIVTHSITRSYRFKATSTTESVGTKIFKCDVSNRLHASERYSRSTVRKIRHAGVLNSPTNIASRELQSLTTSKRGCEWERTQVKRRDSEAAISILLIKVVTDLNCLCVEKLKGGDKKEVNAPRHFRKTFSTVRPLNEEA